jgi:ubiquitin-protein ligase
MTEFLDTDSLYALEIVSLRIKRRIIRELIALFNVSSSIMIGIDNNKKVPVITVQDNLYNSYNIYSFIIHDSYPFRPPGILINSIPYIQFCRINAIGFCKNLKQVGDIYCFCCNSIIHSVKWSPATKLTDIIMEIRNFKKMRRDVINKIFIDIITRKYLIKDINLYSWLF